MTLLPPGETPMRALELFNDGKLSESIAAAIEEVKSHPADVSKRLILSELLCFIGEFEKADKHLETAFLQSPDLNLPTALGRQLIRAATARRKWFDDCAVPDMLPPVDPIVEQQLKLWTLHRAGDADLVTESINHLQSYCDSTDGIAGEVPFTGFRDLDDSTAACLEVLTSTGKYYWVPWHRIEILEFEPVRRPRDLLWREAHIVVRQGPDAVVYVPVIYPATSVNDGDQALLGRSTHWQESETGAVMGIGQRIFLINDQEKAILDLEQVHFDDRVASEVAL
jgi:type VI secretion system protein ImpE